MQKENQSIFYSKILPRLMIFFLIIAIDFFSLTWLTAQPKVTLKIENSQGLWIPVYCEVARTPASRSKGLMYRKHLSPNAGMLFVFNEDIMATFWMKNTMIPLDIAYISNDRIIREIYHMAPQSEDLISSKDYIRYALEVNLGFFKAHKILPGARVRWSNTGFK